MTRPANSSFAEAVLPVLALFVIFTVAAWGIAVDSPAKAQQPAAPAVEDAAPPHPSTKGRYSVTWQEVGGEVHEPFSLMILKDAVDGSCYLIDGTLVEKQVNFGPKVPCE